MKTTTFSIVFILSYHIALAQNVGIGTTTPLYKLDVRNGSINTDSFYRMAGRPVLSVSGLQNSFAGNFAAYNGTGSNNTGTGQSSFLGNNNNNTGLGHRALSGIAGDNNTGAGYSVMNSYYFSRYNTAIGSGSLTQVTIDNTAIGFNALPSLTFGQNNTAAGANALAYNERGSNNVAIGYAALFADSIGTYNTAVGETALFANDGSQNTAVGQQALFSNRLHGNYNTAAGFQSLYSTLMSEYNTAAGYAAANSYNMASDNVIIGAEADVSSNLQYNSIAIGNLATCPGGSTVRIGNSANWSYGGYANWTNISDGRYKKNIEENVTGLNFIMKLKPVTYNLDAAGLHTIVARGKSGTNNKNFKAAILEKEKMIWTGFIAQDVEKAATETGFVFSGVEKPSGEKGLYGLRYEEFVVPLVKALQENQAMIDSLQKTLHDLCLETNKNIVAFQQQIELGLQQNEKRKKFNNEGIKQTTIKLHRFKTREVVQKNKSAK